ncbi:MAG TPA: deoxyribodipyrimidine photo-lyase [Acidimicrobiales bacterium]|nr:deoxyribodipyrimidine photo-lyase [Acidimicrobiales bacterium]
MTGRNGLLVFTRDLRLRDHPALVAAVTGHEAVVPAFVVDEAIVGRLPVAPTRLGFLLESLTDLDGSLRRRGGRLVVRRGDWVQEVLALAAAGRAGTIHVTDDVSPYARDRLARLSAAATGCGVAVERHPGVAVVAPGALAPAGSDHYRVFTPYWRRWTGTLRRPVLRAPRRIHVPGRLPAGRLADALGDLGAVAPPVRGGETSGRRRLLRWRGRLPGYGAGRDALVPGATSSLSAALHLGCLSPLETVATVEAVTGADAFVRQLCWRDFFLQLLAARPEAAWRDLRPGRRHPWVEDPRGLAAWKSGRTGYPLVDAALRQLRNEGFVPNRARMVAASFLTRDLGIDWRHGARHFLSLLVDGDVASNNLSWQWVAGTGTDTDPRRSFNPTRQGHRFDPAGSYVRRHVPELAAVPGAAVHDPSPRQRRAARYPPPIVDHDEAMARLLARRG